jgi:hypothetical protein
MKINELNQDALYEVAQRWMSESILALLGVLLQAIDEHSVSRWGCCFSGAVGSKGHGTCMPLLCSLYI